MRGVEHVRPEGIGEERSGPGVKSLRATNLWTCGSENRPSPPTSFPVPASSTCREATADDPTAVIDQYGRVHGTQGLRVSDALIVPEAVRANWNLTVIAMTELAADFVRES